ncbi:hypothetical protein BDV06DRAFT_233777 [Aspergillus oleicola]
MSEFKDEETIQDRRQRLSSIPKAVRCDRTNPCANCRTAGIVCQQAGAKTGETRVKPVKVSRLESLIERLDSRLGRIEDQLKDSSRQPTPEKVTVDSGSTLVYEGASSFNNASAEATEVAKFTALSQGNGGGDNLTTSFDDLKSLLQPAATLDDFQFSNTNILRSIPAMNLPSSTLVADIVRSFKVRTPFFLMSYPMNDLTMVEDLFRKVYFPTEPVSVGHVTAMHGILLSLLKEFIGLKDPLAEKYDLSAHLPLCEKNFSIGMQTYEILVVPSFENILTVLLAVIKAQDEANVLLSSTFISVAARHCMLLGYHRAATYQNLASRTASNISRLFWMVYVVEKNMSLLLGRASCIQDYDVDVGIPPHSEDPSIRPWDEVFVKNVTLGKLQGQIYDRIYSATALKTNPEIRIQYIQSLAQELHDWHRSVNQIDFSQITATYILDLCRPTWDIMYYSILTSLLRGASTSITAPEITSQCYQAARSALQSHMRLFPVYVESTHMSAGDYANWLMLYSSFTPFIVISLHAIAARSLEDTLLLEDVVRTLHPIKSTSKACARLFQICTIFSRVARALVESNNSFLGAYDSTNDSFLLMNDVALAQGQGVNSVFDPSYLQEYFGNEVDMLGVENGVGFTCSEAEDVSAVLGSWVSGLPATVDFLGMGG